MPVRIRIYGKEAEFSQGCWTCDDDSLLALLEALADPRARTEAEEREHATYAAGRLGGLVATAYGWEAAPMPAPEITLEDVMPGASKREAKSGGLLGLLRRRR
ncbi:hypothetical protein [Deinococcus hohokamensis]|uniref:Uncharacterized protein n=1 Tax=Deinococcus hohokamensis TaxID=309883 RepID=A0ABV9I7Q4_9DEIO